LGTDKYQTYKLNLSKAYNSWT